MKKNQLILFILLCFYFVNYVSAQQTEKKSVKLSYGLANQFFIFNEEKYSAISPTVEVQLSKRFFIISEYKRFKKSDIEDISNVRDGIPRIISEKRNYQHIPLSLKLIFIDKADIDYFLKITVTNQFTETNTSIYTFNKATTTNRQNNYTMLYGGSIGFDFDVCNNSKIGIDTFFKTGKNFHSRIFGLNLNYMFNLNRKNYEN